MRQASTGAARYAGYICLTQSNRMDIGCLYSGLKMVHICCAALSISLFAIRGIWRGLLQYRLWRWLHIVPHAIDALLLASGITLAILIQQSPFFNSPWMTAKVTALLVYIALGIWLFRGPDWLPGRALIGGAALLTAAYIVSVAMTRHPAGWTLYWL